ncbi:hypothetical protein CEXT_718201 [Caerostris extrusa]|uniref:Uncharacterized protein n=1 Tax=Caerostris extrusa TaxID=172846 RepID=A0AAV4Q381_CAEEX|nr:hypothetical protein CEXT_718201 [Caerostris extrusa]
MDYNARNYCTSVVFLLVQVVKRSGWKSAKKTKVSGPLGAKIKTRACQIGHGPFLPVAVGTELRDLNQGLGEQPYGEAHFLNLSFNAPLRRQHMSQRV